MNRNITIREFINFNTKRKVEHYYDFFFENFALPHEESNIYKKRIQNILEDELSSYYFDFNHWFVKNDKTSKSLSNLNSEIGHLTKKWTIDWTWIIHHVILDFLNIGLAEYLFKKYGSSVLVYKWLPESYLPLAEKVYLKNIKTREPKVFKLIELINYNIFLNLNNSELRPSIGITLWSGFDNEIWDVTELRKCDEKMIWDKQKKGYIYDEKALIEEEKKLGLKGKIKVKIGNKEFYV